MVGLLSAKHLFRIALICTCLLSVQYAAAQEIELNGLVIDQTRTRTGRDFYREFTSVWGEPDIDFSYHIVIIETPDARWGNLITINVNGRRVYQKAITRTTSIKDDIKQALRNTSGFVSYLMRTKNGSDSEDLAGNGY